MRKEGIEVFAVSTYGGDGMFSSRGWRLDSTKRAEILSMSKYHFSMQTIEILSIPKYRFSTQTIEIPSISKYQ